MTILAHEILSWAAFRVAEIEAAGYAVSAYELGDSLFVRVARDGCGFVERFRKLIEIEDEPWLVHDMLGEAVEWHTMVWGMPE